MPGWVQWMNPIWVWALPLAVLLPLLAHLLSRQGGKLALFPAVRFVQLAIASQSRWYTPRQWLMLLLRILILAMVIAAFARPIWWRAQSAATNGQGIAAILILDASASMQRSAGGFSLFDDARQQVITALETLDPQRDRAMVMVLDARPHLILPRMSANFSELIGQVRALEPTWERGDLAAALAMCSNPAWDTRDMAARSPATIHLYSDMQQTQWPASGELESLLKNSAFEAHGVGESQDNLAIFNPSVSPSSPVPGQEVMLSVEVANFSKLSSQPVKAQVVMTAGEQKIIRSVMVAAGGRTRLNIPWKPPKAGPLYVHFALTATAGNTPVTDVMKADDQTGLYVQVTSSRQVTLVTAADIDDADQSSYYLKRALTPAADPAANDVQLQVWTPAMLAQNLASLSPASAAFPSCIVLTQAGLLDAAALEALHVYLLQGGGVWWFIDSQQSADALTSWKSQEGLISPLLAMTGSRLQMETRVDGMLTVGNAAFDQPELGVFDGPSRAALLRPYFQTTFAGQLADDAQGLLYLNVARRPLLAYRAVGPGRLAILAADISPMQGSLVKQPVFVALVHQMIRSLSPELLASSSPVAGAMAYVTLTGLSETQSQSLYIQTPGQLKQPVASPDQMLQEAKYFLLPDTSQPGPYEVRATTGDELLGGVYVGVAAEESNLASTPPPRESASPAAAGGVAARSTQAISGEPNKAGLREYAVELWPYLIAMAAVLLAMESLLCGVDSASRQTSPGGEAADA